MAYEFKKEQKYLVVKTDDLDRLISDTQWEELQKILDTVKQARHKLGKKENSYVVVNEDEPYSGIVWELVKMGEYMKVYGYKTKC